MANHERPNAFHKPALPAKSRLLHKGDKSKMQEINQMHFAYRNLLTEVSH